MKTIVAKTAGFCWGVRRAVETARQTAAQAGYAVYTDGPLIHNRGMMSQLQKENVSVCTAPASLPRGSVLIIRAHGIPPERRRMLEGLPLKLVDATCPDVARIHRIIEQKSKEGFSVVIFGDKNHAEVVGLLGYASGDAYVVSSVAETDSLPLDLKKVLLVSQTTQSPDIFERVAGAMRRRYETVCVENTICRSTRARQEDLKSLAAQCDVIVVVGSPESANTARLAEKAALLRPTVVIDNASQLSKDSFRGFSSVGITAGASTPDFIIKQVEESLKSF